METVNEKKAGCPFCGTHFSHRSSLIRHLKNNCNKSQSQSLRRKSCHQCVADKAKCNLRRPTCSRCSLRSVSCQYTSAKSTESLTLETENHDFSIRGGGADTSPVPSLTTQLQDSQSIFDPNLFDSCFSSLASWDLTQPTNLNLRSPRRTVDADLLSLNDNNECESPELIRAISLPPGRHSPSVDTNSIALARHSMELIFRVLKSWPKMLAEEFQLPPLFHSTHITQGKTLPLPLAKCITLTKMWHGQCEGAEEMSNQLDETDLLASLQAVVIYTIILLSPSSSSQPPLTDHNIVFRKVELLVYQIVHAGLFLEEERTQMRPSWEAWVHVTTKRRAVLALYLLHWAYSVLHEVPCFDCRDLGFMPAPAAKVLWQAQSEQEWNTRYIHWLSRWSGQCYLQGEFGNIRPGVVMDARAERWLEEADEFGFIMISIVNATDFDPPSLKALAH
ncbi:hypothetical protein PENARI_c007G09280 [Penicillium arizonense]|uniref:Uncharacterized protein n=1 Tax=Penicillium arizonense TaxID=1835702 RepID=A0A1F5LKK2_PENAI|nr:hypothetical protein PENARI_c007G09280 [Penicillium arizonense]OGE53748.1 hypothetical protein PENARI_c007G09280 [Penicillium arizonense]